MTILVNTHTTWKRFKVTSFLINCDRELQNKMAAICVQIGARLCVSASHDTSSRGLDLDEKWGLKGQENAAGPPSVNNNSFVCAQPDYMKSHQALPQTRFVTSFPSNSIWAFLLLKNKKTKKREANRFQTRSFQRRSSFWRGDFFFFFGGGRENFTC